MKISPSIRKICQKCTILRRYKKLYVICTNLKHKQRQK